MNRVAGVDQQDVGLFLADAFDERGDLRQPPVVRFVCVVIDRIDIAVKIGGAKDRYLHALGREAATDQNQRQHDKERREGIDKG